MKTLLALVIAFLAVTSAYAAVPIFNATLTVGKDSRFVLVGSDGKASSWLQVGDTFDGYKVKAYDAKANALDLEKDGNVTRVTLASDATVKAGALAPTPGTLSDAENVLNKMHFDELLTKALDRQKKMVNASFEQSVNRMVASGVSKEDAIGFRQKLMEEVQSIIDPSQLKGDVTKIYSEVFTKDELDGMAAFYTTPLGETVANKQADVQEKLGALIQSRMQQAMPRIQQISREFMMDQKAKKEAAAAAAAAPAPVAPAAPAPAPAPAAGK